MTRLLTLQIVKTVYQSDGMPGRLTPSVEQVVKADFVADKKGLSPQHEVLASITVTNIPHLDAKYGVRKQDHMILDTIISPNSANGNEPVNRRRARPSAETAQGYRKCGTS